MRSWLKSSIPLHSCCLRDEKELKLNDPVLPDCITPSWADHGWLTSPTCSLWDPNQASGCRGQVETFLWWSQVNSQHYAMRVPRAFLAFLSYPVLSLVFHSCWLRWRWPPTYNCLAFRLRSKAWGQLKQKRFHQHPWHQCSGVHGLLPRWIYVRRSQQSLAKWQNSGHGRFWICIHKKWVINTRDSFLESLKKQAC